MAGNGFWVLSVAKEGWRLHVASLVLLAVAVAGWLFTSHFSQAILSIMALRKQQWMWALSDMTDY